MSAPPALHPLGVGELLDAAIYVYRKNFITLIGIGAVIAVPLLLLQFADTFINARATPFFWGDLALTPLSSTASSRSPFYLAVIVVAGLLRGTAGVFEMGALAFTVSEWHLGRRVTIGGAYRQALHHWTALFISSILIQLFGLAGFGLIFVPMLLTAPSTVIGYVIVGLILPGLIAAVYPTVRWSLTSPAIVLENLGALKGMGRSWRLIKGSFWRTLVLLALVRILANLLTYIILFSVQYPLAFHSIILAVIATSTTDVVIGVLIQPLEYIVITIFYYDLRIRHEGYDLQLALDQLKQSAPVVSTEAPA